MQSVTLDVQEIKSRLTRRLGVRGIVAIAFGIVMLVWPGPTVVALTYLFGAMAGADGLLAIRSAVTDAGREDRWWLGFTGVVGVIAAITAFAWPAMTALGLLYLIGTWAIVVGGGEVAAAIFGSASGTRRHVLALHGLLSVAFGVVMWSRPGAGALVLVSLVAILAIARGVALCGMALDVRRSDDVVPPAVTTTAQASAA